MSNNGLIVSGNVGIGTLTPTGTLSVTRQASSIASVFPCLEIDPVADTLTTASTEFPNVYFNFSAATWTWSTGNITTQRFFLTNQPTIAFSGSSSVTDVATLGISGAPAQGLNAYVVNSHGALVSSSSLGSQTSAWISETSASSNAWPSIAWSHELRIFAAVASAGSAGNQVMTSSNGTTWTSQTAASSNDWTSVTWSSQLGIFAAVAAFGSAGNQVMTSSNGTTWTSQTAASSNQWESITWSPQLGLFAAVASSGSAGNQVMTSSNVTNWTSQTAAFSNNWVGVTWSPQLGIFVAVASLGSAGNQVMTSSNGTTWTSQTAASSNSWQSITWSPDLGIFAAVADFGSAGNQVMTSSNGTTWSTRTAASSNFWVGITWSPQLGIFAAVALNGSAGNQVMTSSNGTTWTSQTAASSNQWTGVTWSSDLGIFAAVALSGTAGNQVMIYKTNPLYSYGLSVNAQTGAVNNYAAQFIGGKVGIGTATPATTLDIAGSINATTWPTGMIIQTKKAITTAQFTVSSTGSWFDWTNMNVTILPRSSSSKFIIFASSGVSNSTGNSFQYVRLQRNGVTIATGDAAGPAEQCWMDAAWGDTSVKLAYSFTQKTLSAVYVDAPATTSLITYKLQVQVTLNTTASFGRTSDLGDGNRSTIPNTIIVMEIAG